MRAPNPGPLTGTGTNTWLFGSQGEVVVLDPGPASAEHLAAVSAAAQTMGVVVAIACTHHHPDHVEGAQELAQAVQAPLAVHHSRARGDDLSLHDGDRLLVGGAGLTALHTPGHASDHLCFFDPVGRTLFTGDHVLSGSTSLIQPPDGEMAAYLESLARVRGLGAARLLPGHGQPIAEPGPALRQLIEHRREREAQVLAQLSDEGIAAAELVPRLYRDYPQQVWELAAGTVLAHLIKLEAEGRARRLEATEPPRFVQVHPAPTGPEDS